MKALSELSQRRAEKKRRRDEDEAWTKNIKRKLRDEEGRVTASEADLFSSNKELYSLFNELQVIAQEYDCSLQ